MNPEWYDLKFNLKLLLEDMKYYGQYEKFSSLIWKFKQNEFALYMETETYVFHFPLSKCMFFPITEK